MKIKIIFSSLIAASLLTPAEAAFAKKNISNSDEVDHVSLAAMMIRDGHTDRAAAELSEVNVEQEGVDLSKYWLLKGIVGLKQGEFENAKACLENALANGQTDPMTWVFMAQAQFRLGDCAGSLSSLKKSGDRGSSLPGIFALEAQCQMKEGRPSEAYSALTRGLKIHEGNEELTLRRILLLIDMKLFVEATEEGKTFLEREDISSKECAIVSEALIESGQARRAVIVLEEARLRFPESEEIAVQLARAYFRWDRPLIAARIYEELSRKKQELLVDAAELYKRGGKPLRALYLNGQIKDQKTKIRQRLGLLIELNRYEEAAALENRARRLGLAEEDAVAYALAYSLFKIGRTENLEKYLSKIRDKEIFGKAMELRRAVEKCEASAWECEIAGIR